MLEGYSDSLTRCWDFAAVLARVYLFGIGKVSGKAPPDDEG